MRTVDLIQKKRDGHELSEEEIAFLIDGYTKGEIPDYQMAAWAMAVYFQGMTAAETAQLTMAMVRSGEQMDLSGIPGVKVDKHSTGGVGDTTSLLLVPLLAAAGVPVAKMSGRGLGHTGGTIDKLEAIPGFRTELTRDEFIDQVKAVGASIIGQSGNFTPADKKLYGLRDVTATVNSIPLIASSIMSKKIAAGADAILLDVKTGGGAFMKTLDDSIKLAQAMVAIGTEVGRETVALITGMEQPLGSSVGNALEVKEAIEALHGLGSPRLQEVALTLGSHMLVLGRKASDLAEARKTLAERITDGSALAKLKELATAQGGDASVIDDPSLLPAASRVEVIPSGEDGYVQAIEAEEIGLAAMMLGAGRPTKEANIDLAVGIVLHKGIGDAVKKGEPLAELHVNSPEPVVAEVVDRVIRAFTLSSQPVEKPPLVYAVVSKNGVERLDGVRT
ncbi:pyrimidine-nucleoside phosphorylase [Gorillibacterium timonense]|uniref:pyrimidine-nucleoside phosphorylase n=1 Tax=Gorillibacterium timonense TaxID=1689269 RepID=UPI00071DCEA5|nr:pyrimidine-nucleoside phosphorylase [Gorillibacterium timonense]